MVTELPEDVLAYLKVQGRWGNAGAMDLLDKYAPEPAPAPNWLPGDVVVIHPSGNVYQRDETGWWWRPKGGGVDDNWINPFLPHDCVLVVRDGKPVTA